MVIQWDEPEAENGPIEVYNYFIFDYVQNINIIEITFIMICIYLFIRLFISNSGL